MAWKNDESKMLQTPEQNNNPVMFQIVDFLNYISEN